MGYEVDETLAKRVQTNLNICGANPQLKTDGDPQLKTWTAIDAQLAKDAAALGGGTVSPPPVIIPPTNGGLFLFPTTAYARGKLQLIDMYDGDTITNMQTLLAQNIKLALLKVSQGTTNMQTLYPSRVAEFHAYLIPISPWHFADFSKTGSAQAQWACKGIAAAGGLAKTDGILWFDWEYASQDTDVNPAADLQVGKDFVNEAQQILGRKVGLYMDYSLPEDLKEPSWLADQILWLARPGVTNPVAPNPFSNTTMAIIQYAETSFPGMQGNEVDLDYFNGNEDDLAAFIASTFL